jgi:hypothetical protein
MHHINSFVNVEWYKYFIVYISLYVMITGLVCLCCARLRPVAVSLAQVLAVTMAVST